MEASLLIDQILDEFKAILGKDYLKYKNHAYRVYHLSMILDSNTENGEKYAISSAFHDLGIWTDNSFDYLNPSIQLAKNWLAQEGKAEWFPEISSIIDMHHKMSIYKGQYQLTVETFRKADLVDLSYGLITFKVGIHVFKGLLKQFPTKGFHRFLLGRTVLNILQHPINPLPMFKR